MLEGKILNDSIEKASLSVVNISLRKGAITNSNGEFTIPVRVGDTINISAVQYETRRAVISEKIYRRQRLSLYLVPKINELEEVFLDNNILFGRLDKDAAHDILREDLEAIEKADALGLLPDLEKKTIEERRFHTATTGTGEIDINFVTAFKLSLPRIINGISGKTKKLKKHQQVANYQKQLENIRANFSHNFYTEILGIPEISISDFITYLIEQHNLLKIDTGNTLLLLEFMQERAPYYLKSLSEDQLPTKDD